MPSDEECNRIDGVNLTLDRIGRAAPVQSNCLFQLALMLARIALEPCTDAYRDEAALAIMGLIRAKPKGNVMRLFAVP